MAQVIEPNKDKTVLQPPPLRISRVFHARRETVFKAWSSADHVKRWFSPETYIVSDAKVQMRVGGPFEVCMRSPNGGKHWTRGTFVEVAPHSRLVIDMRIPAMQASRYFSPGPKSTSPTRPAERAWTWCRPTRSSIRRSQCRWWQVRRKGGAPPSTNWRKRSCASRAEPRPALARWCTRHSIWSVPTTHQSRGYGSR